MVAGKGGDGRRGRTAGGGQGGRAGKSGSSRKGSTTGSGGHGRRRLEGRGATPPAEMRPGHPAQRRAAAARRTAGGSAAAGRDRARGDGGPVGSERAGGREPSGRRPPGREQPEFVAGRNSVVEALRAEVPATALYVGLGLDRDERVDEAVALAGQHGISILEAGRAELDRRTQGALHQGLALQVPPYSYAHPDDLVTRAQESTSQPLLVALDGVTDPRNLGAVVRSVAAFGGHGVVIPERRAAGISAGAWKASAGAAARVPVARATNLARTLRSYADAGLFVVGLTADGDVDLDDLEVAVDPLVLVVGSEGRGLSRLVEQACDLTARIPMVSDTESLNAGVAAAVALAEVARRRRTTSR